MLIDLEVLVWLVAVEVGDVIELSIHKQNAD